MKIYELINESNHIYAFEYSSSLISMKSLKLIIDSIPGVSNVQMRSPFGDTPDIVAKFEIDGNEYMVWEAFADNSRYWVGPYEAKQDLDISKIRSAFESHEPSMIRKVLGCLG